MTWLLAYVSCNILVMCWDKHHQMTLPSKNFLCLCIKHKISAVVNFNLSLQTIEETSLDRLTANRGIVGITSIFHRYAVGCILSSTCKLTVIHSRLTGSLPYIRRNFPLFVIIFLTFSTTASHGSKTPQSGVIQSDLSQMMGASSNALLAETQLQCRH
jgi:hypothetical protein